jgi:hypothetical protein
VKPREASVYVDGYYAGTVDDFDGFMQSLPLPPGGHDIALYLEGFRTLRRSVYLRPGSHLHIRETLVRLGAGEVNEPPPAAPAVPAPPAGSYAEPRSPNPRPRAGGAPPQTPPAQAFGTLDLQVEPHEAEVTVDGRRWLTSDDGHYIIDVPAGSHTVEISQPGAAPYRRTVVVREGESVPLNVSVTGR